MADPFIPVADLPRVTPGAFDSVVGVDEATGEARRFPMPVSGTPKAYEAVSDLPATANEGTPAYVNNDPTVTNNGLWAFIGGAWVQSDDRVTGVEGRMGVAEGNIEANTLSDADISLNLPTEHSTKFVRYPADNGWSGATGYHSWGVGYLAGSPRMISRISMLVDYVSVNEKLTLKVYSRPAAEAASVDAPGVGVNDLLLQTVEYLATSFDDTTDRRRIDLDFPDVVASPDSIILFEVVSLKAGGAQGQLGNSNAGALPGNQFTRGWFNNGSDYSVITSTASLAFELSRERPSVDDLDRRISDVESAAGTAHSIKHYIKRKANGFSGAAGFYTWAFGYVPPSDEALSRLSLECDYVEHNDTLTLEVYRRPIALASSVAGPGESTDELMQSVDFDASLFEPTLERQFIDLDFEPIIATSDWIFLFVVTATVEGANGLLGVTNADTAPLQYERGWYKNAGGFSTIGAGNSIARVLSNAVPAFESIDDSYEQIVSGASVSGLSVALDAVLSRSGRRFPLRGNYAVSATTTPARVTLLNMTLAYSAIASPVQASVAFTDGVDSEGAGELVRNVYDVEVRRTSDSVLLTEGVDYQLFAHAGKMRGSNSGVASVQVDVSFDYYPERYDVIQVDPESLAVTVVQGTERKRDAGEYPYRAAAAAGKSPIYTARVVGPTVSLIDATEWDGLFQQGRESEWLRYKGRAEAALSGVLGRLHQGLPITLAGYGDSITAMQVGSLFGVYTANGASRDRIDYFEMPPETDAAVGIYDFGDGAGAVHAKAGWNWYLKAHLESKFGVAVTYNNYGIGSTTSAATEDNGLYPARIAQVVADAPHLTVVAFGMNEVGSTATYANVKSIVEQLVAAGSDVIVIGCPRPNAHNPFSSYSEWQLTNRALRRAAIDGGGAFVPTLYAMNDGQLGLIGMPAASLCSANFYNHPGPTELRLYGQLLAGLF